ncbi:hypothetical protein NE237_001481 [Protea cynaroides]|uniref:Secreted protein n=1 Tax=Protea cynaroides TaxID=273540 RepID=A0A9Q0QY55_9MAGN|nr:hypothetical protein NE237_001481 [Protea cynaroides]
MALLSSQCIIHLLLHYLNGSILGFGSSVMTCERLEVFERCRTGVAVCVSSFHRANAVAHSLVNFITDLQMVFLSHLFSDLPSLVRRKVLKRSWVLVIYLGNHMHFYMP